MKTSKNENSINEIWKKKKKARKLNQKKILKLLWIL